MTNVKWDSSRHRFTIEITIMSMINTILFAFLIIKANHLFHTQDRVRRMCIILLADVMGGVYTVSNVFRVYNVIGGLNSDCRIIC